MHGSKAWILRTKQGRTRTLNLQVALPKKPCALYVNKKKKPFKYKAGVLTTTVKVKTGTVEARASCNKA